jgi:hypothetical protein
MLEIVDDILLCFEQIKKEQSSSKFYLFKEIFHSLNQHKYDRETQSLLLKQKLIEDVRRNKESFTVFNKNDSRSFNMLKMFKISENQHSYLLAHLLDPNATHGQNHLFLNAFLDKIGILRERDDENWIVSAEKGRIDILLKRMNPHAVVVIENKSNYAPDQQNQLYRYWYQQVYTPIIERHLPNEFKFAPPESFYQIIYLSPHDTKTPATDTLNRPENWESHLPEIVPMKIKNIFYSEFICNWLEECLPQLPVNNSRLKEYVKQYIEYWN